MTDLVLRYSKGAFLPPLILLLVGMVFLNLFVSLSFGFDAVSASLAALASAVLVLTVGISPLMTNHALSANELVLRQGWLFHSVIPRDEIDIDQHLGEGTEAHRRLLRFQGDDGLRHDATTQPHPAQAQEPTALQLGLGEEDGPVGLRLAGPKGFPQGDGIGSGNHSRQSRPIVRNSTLGISGILRLCIEPVCIFHTISTFSCGIMLRRAISSNSMPFSIPKRTASRSS